MNEKELDALARNLSIEQRKELIKFSINMVECITDYIESVKELSEIIGDWMS